MIPAKHELPLSESLTPADQRELCERLREAFNTRTPVYPIGGATSLDFGLPARLPGWGVELRALNRIVDYPARDLTVTVEAGVTISELSRLLAPERQELPIDVPQADRATIGGVIATNTNGLRRLGCGAIRDYVIGIRAIDGRGVEFNGGGRVVKNVAGYDFCKLLTGSLGTLGIISQVTLKVRPIAERRTAWIIYPATLEQADSILARVEAEPWSPVAAELLMGPAAITPPLDTTRKIALILVLEGSLLEVDWVLKRVRELLREHVGREHEGIGEECAAEELASLWEHLCEFPARAGSPLVAAGAVVPSGLVQFIPQVLRIDPDCSIQVHAGSGSFVLRFSQLPDGGLSRAFVGELQVEASRLHGHLAVLSNPGKVEVTRQSTWGVSGSPIPLMLRVKKQFDPANILNTGRFFFD